MGWPDGYTATGELSFINDSLQALIDSTLNWLQNDSILFSIDSLYQATSTDLRLRNNSINTIAISQWNRKRVNNIKMATLLKGIIIFTTSQENNLRYIANQCELEGGNAVTEARMMLVLIDSVMLNYSSCCNGYI